MKSPRRKSLVNAESPNGMARISIILGVIQFVMTGIAYMYVLPDIIQYYSLLSFSRYTHYIYVTYFIFLVILCLGLLNMINGTKLLYASNTKKQKYLILARYVIPLSVLFTCCTWFYTYQLIQLPIGL